MILIYVHLDSNVYGKNRVHLSTPTYVRFILNENSISTYDVYKLLSLCAWNYHGMQQFLLVSSIVKLHWLALAWDLGIHPGKSLSSHLQVGQFYSWMIFKASTGSKLLCHFPCIRDPCLSILICIWNIGSLIHGSTGMFFSAVTSPQIFV